MDACVSIVIPAYNVQSYIRTCLESVCTQSYANLDIIVINDGSTDSTPNIIKEFAQTDKRIRKHDIPNSGVSTARNIGIKLAAGDFLMFVDADDALFPDAISTLILAFDNCDCDMSVGQYIQTDEHGNAMYTPNPRLKPMTFGRDDAINLMFRMRPYNYQGYLWNKIFKLSIIKRHKIGFDPNIKFNEDRLFNIEYIIEMSGKMYVSPLPIYRHNIHKNSAMGKLSESFNPNVISDHTSSLQIFHRLKNARFGKITMNLARDRILESCDMIRHNAKKSDSTLTYREIKILYKKSISMTGGQRYFFYNRLRRFLSRQINSICKHLGLRANYWIEA